jgi:hypothetical protein
MTDAPEDLTGTAWVLQAIAGNDGRRCVDRGRNNFTAYGAFYLVLAESLEMPLFTDDRKFAKASAATSTATIETWR